VKNQIFNEETIDLAVEKLTERQDMLDWVDSLSIIPLNTTCEDALFKQINKCLVSDDRIYLLDYFGNASLTVWNKTGNFLVKIGSQGQGAGEYHKITDFDVVDKTVYLLDSSQRKILSYTLDGHFLKEYVYNGKLEGINDLAVTSDGNFLLGLDVELSSGNQVILTDSDFDVKRVVLSFDDKTTKGHLNIGCFKRCGTNIVYNYPVSDDIYIFNTVGELVKKYKISFEKGVPEDIRNNYQEIAKQRRTSEFAYFYEPPLVCGNILLSSIFYDSKKALLAVDLQKHTFLKKIYDRDFVFSLSYLNFPIYMDDECVCCWLNPAVYAHLDEDSKKRMGDKIVQHLEEGENALVIYHLK